MRAGYLTTTSGVWDGESVAAMQKLQAAHGWQTKLVPDSRAIILLGLGGRANAGTSVASETPETAETPTPATDPTRSTPVNQ